jgi:nucleoside-diphosphate-sugar epimerase
VSGSILVTGAGGFIGRHLVAALQSKGHTVATHSIEDGDIARDELSFSGIEHVFHLAGQSFVPESWRDPRRFCETNVLGAINVLEFCRRQAASLTYVSSYVYGQPLHLPISEEHPRSAPNPYALSKIMGEDACMFYARQMGLRICIVRPFNIYGPGQDSRFLIPTIAEQALAAPDGAIVVADLRPKRDFLYVSDFVSLLVATFEHQSAGIYNAGSGVSVSIGELVAMVTSITGERKLVSREERREHEILEVRAGIRKAQRELNWQPCVSLQAGIREVIASISAAGPVGSGRAGKESGS